MNSLSTLFAIVGHFAFGAQNVLAFASLGHRDGFTCSKADWISCVKSTRHCRLEYSKSSSLDEELFNAWSGVLEEYFQKGAMPAVREVKINDEEIEMLASMKEDDCYENLGGNQGHSLTERVIHPLDSERVSETKQVIQNCAERAGAQMFNVHEKDRSTVSDTSEDNSMNEEVMELMEETAIDTLTDIDHVSSNEYLNTSSIQTIGSNEVKVPSKLSTLDPDNGASIALEERISYKDTISNKQWTESTLDDETTTNNDLDIHWHNSIDRRKQRIQSLDSFNQAAKSQKQPNQQYATQRPNHDPPSLNLPYNDPSQLQAIQSNAPAILLSSGPGTGKSHVLSLRIAYLLRMQLDYQTDNNNNNVQSKGISSTPDSMIILSFTNKDAERLKENALNLLFPPEALEWREQTSRQLWSGTMHVFALAILRKYGYYSAGTPLRVLPARAMRNRVSLSLRVLLNSGGEDGEDAMDSEEMRLLRLRHLQALHDVGQSRSILYQNIVKCIDLWKEALLIPSTCGGDEVSGEQKDKKELELRKDCVELAIRLGIPQSSALIALDVFPTYQAQHAAAGTADPSDLAGMAYRLLLANTEALHLLRAKLKHIIVDEYQDISVSQHALLRLVVRGKTDDDCENSTFIPGEVPTNNQHKRQSPILADISSTTRSRATLKKRPHATASLKQNYNVPNLFAAGDTRQSIYGWRAAAPLLSIDGFRRDYPQGVVAALGTCYRLPKDILEASSMLLDKEEEYEATSYEVSPAAANKVASSIHSNHDTHLRKSDARVGESLLLSRGLQKLDSTVLIHGLWDSREEYKYIAATIRRRSKERRKALVDALNDTHLKIVSDKDQFDFTDVAVMVRSSNQINLLKEALNFYGIPFIVAGVGNDLSNGTNEHATLMTRKQAETKDTIPMKPAILMTMHRSKGEEFDDVYLAGWSEGSFPHPDAVSSNLIHEERRLGYVAMTRARQRVVITHSLMSRTLHYSKDGTRKYVTCQVQPSRFLYELVPSKKKVDGILDSAIDEDEPFIHDNVGTVWNRNAGIKEYVAGQNVPEFFQKAYQQPRNSVEKRSDLRLHTTVNKNYIVKTPKLKDNVGQSKDNRGFRTGDNVVVTYKKHRQYGKMGTIEKVSKCFVFFSDNETKQSIKIKPSFLQITTNYSNENTETLRSKTTKRMSSKFDSIDTNKTERSKSELAKLTVPQLKSRLRQVRLPVSGKKSELIDRLRLSNLRQ